MNVIIGFISESVPPKIQNFRKLKIQSIFLKHRHPDYPVLRCRLGRSRRWQSFQQDHAW